MHLVLPSSAFCCNIQFILLRAGFSKNIGNLWFMLPRTNAFTFKGPPKMFLTERIYFMFLT